MVVPPVFGRAAKVSVEIYGIDVHQSGKKTCLCMTMASVDNRGWLMLKALAVNAGLSAFIVDRRVASSE